MSALHPTRPSEPRNWRLCRRAAGLAVWIPLVIAITPGRSKAAASLDERLRGVLDDHRGRVAIVVEHLNTGERFARNADEPMPTASLIKFPIMAEAYRQAEAGDVDLGEMLTLREEDKVPGSGILTTHFSGGLQLSLRDAIRLMIAYSDNTATNLVLDRIGLRSTAETMEDMGYPETKVHAKVYRRDTSVFPDRSERFGLGSTTAADMVDLLGRLHRRELVSPAASEAMLGHLLACESKSMLPRHLPEGTKVYHKTGSVNDARTSAGIIETPGGPVAVCVLTAENEDRRWSDENAAERLIAEVAREVYNHFTSEAPAGEDESSRGRPRLEIGARGPEVERLQRLLNARLEPSPGLSVDGDFGPATESALIRFQRTADLDAHGVADDQTWEALGDMPVTGEQAPDPEDVNAEEAETQPADALDGPPFVTARAWAIADAATGEVLWGDHEEESLDMASTTKIMTALVVLRLAERDPEILDELVTFTDRADGTTGSTAGVRAGERLPVRELLYGLLLPSGNDASVALAEHFGHRLSAPDDAEGDALDPLSRFVSEMNRVADELGLDATRFENPHGLTAEGHHTSASDLARLAGHALDDPMFAEIVATRKRGCTLRDVSGDSRNVVWTNTNRLLGIDGYEGVKTGTTRAAGACLVACGRRGDDRLILVVLGSDSSDARYIDARNLFRWAWNQQEQEGD